MKIAAIALNTFREGVRNKILYTIFVFALIMILSSVALGAITVGSRVKIVTDVGLSCIALFSALISIFLGIGLVSKEIEKKTVYTIVTKPISRLQFLLGKALGLLLTVFIIISVMTAELYIILLFYPSANMKFLFVAPLMSFFESMVIISFAMLFSSFTTQILASIFTLSFYVVGHLSWGLKLLDNRLETQALKLFFNLLYWVLPNLEFLNYRYKIVHGLDINAGFVLTSVAYAFTYSMVLIVLSGIIFERKDLL